MPTRPIGPLALVLACALLAPPAVAQDDAGTEPAADQPAEQPPSTDDLTPLAHVERRGDGPVPMILIPSLWCDWTVWNEFMDRNADRYTMYAVTFPGYAGSEPPPTPGDPRDYTQQSWRDNAARAILRLIRDEKLDKPAIVGHFSGGQLAIRLAIEHPTLVGSVVSIDGPLAVPLGGNTGPATREERTIIVNRRMNAERVPQEFWETQARANAESLVTNPGRAILLGDMMAGVSWPVAKGYWLETIAEDLTDRIRGLRSPLLVIVPVAPELDPAQAAGHRDAWRAMFADVDVAKVVFIEDAHQFVMFDEPERLDEDIAGFLAPPDESPEPPDEGGR